MVAALFGRELRAGLSGDPVPEDGRLAFEFAGFIMGVHPVGDLAWVVGLHGNDG